MARRPIQLFSLSFIDCITCGLGAIILLFVIVNAKSAVRRNILIADLRAETDRIQQEVHEGKQKLVVARNALAAVENELAITQGLARQVLRTLQTHREERAHFEKDSLANKAHVNKLQADLKAVDEELKRLQAAQRAQQEAGSRQRPFPGQGDRQYLTDLKMGGQRILILLDASASMLADTVVDVIRRRNMSEAEQRRSDKWRQAVATVDWLSTQLPSASQYQIYLFNETVLPLIAGSSGKWLEVSNIEMLNQAIAKLRTVTPRHGTSLINAIEALKALQPPPDNVFLLTDSLPTMGAKKPYAKTVSGKRRLRLFEAAVRRLPSGTPINVILYHMEGDPFAAAAFWRLAITTDGAFLSPARDWP